MNKRTCPGYPSLRYPGWVSSICGGASGPDGDIKPCKHYEQNGAGINPDMGRDVTTGRLKCFNKEPQE